MAQIDDKQRRTAEWLADKVNQTVPNRYGLWNLGGAVGSGKTFVLRLLAESLHQQGLTPVTINAPPGEVDTAPVALLTTASQLKAASLLNGEVAVISDPTRHWNEKMDALTEALERHYERVVLLCDEPTRWYRQAESDLDDTPDHCVRSFADWIVNRTNCRRVVTGWIHGFVPNDQKTRAPRLDDASEFLTENAGWGEAQQLADSLRLSLAQPLSGRWIWEVKLCVALCRFRNPRDVVAALIAETPADALLDELLDLLEFGDQYQSLCETLARLAIPRTALGPAVFREMTQTVTDLDRDLISTCLVDWREGSFALHPLVRSAINTRARDPRRSDTNQCWRMRRPDREAWHRRLTAEYPVHNGSDLRGELESLHHDLLGGNTTLPESDERLHFVEQLHEIGRTLSYVHHNHKRAADLFRFALQLDSYHAYSHHYLAFNLDWLADQPDEVETHYQSAIHLQPTHPWWWSRWISYLATRGRFRDARSAWHDALDAMSVSETGSPEWLFRSLHRWVARWLLHWGDLEFAEEVLRSVPREIAKMDTSIQALWDLLAALREAQRDAVVFPLSVPAKEWWSPGPHTDLPLRLHDKQLLSWQPGRIEYIDTVANLVFVLAARRPEQRDGEPEYESIELTRGDVDLIAHDFQWRDLGEGSFIEIGYYGPDSERKVGLHRIVEWRDPRLLPLVPPPDRWYKRAVTEAWTSQVEAD